MQHNKLTHPRMQDQKAMEALSAYHHQKSFLDALMRYVHVLLDTTRRDTTCRDTTCADLPPPPQLTPAPVVEWDEDDFVARLQRHFADAEGEQQTARHKLHDKQAVHQHHHNASPQLHEHASITHDEQASITHKDSSREPCDGKRHGKGDGNVGGDGNADGRYSNEMDAIHSNAQGAPEVQAYHPLYACVCENSVCAVCVRVCLLFVFVVCWRL